ncbi:coat protein F [Desulfitobacterium hafniense]|uniref:Coat protein F n=1 Tax=Desulfitobacterium hafniense TaxID=49338 RepID=A0A0W1JJI0_DESHA|nr:spore coat protein [Desulfitobacterium hafniense]KTE91151.1 coat protein F [Desulfitobacterium hafniense]
MQVQLSQKEQMLLKDLKGHEELCVEKYSKYAKEAECANLSQMFQNLASREQQHYNTISQIMTGQVPSMNQGQGQQGQGQQAQGMQQQGQGMQGQSGSQGMSGMQSQGSNNYSQKDFNMLSDMLATEKYVSGTYDTSIFEFVDPNLRQVLNHIQKEEQEHGEEIFNYMHSHGMYPIQ